MWPLNETELLTLLNAIFGAALVFVSTLYWVGRKASHAKAAAATKAAEAVALRVTSLEGKLALVDQAVVPISAAFQAILIKELTHYHTPEMDELLTKVGPPSTLTASEIDDLARLLQAHRPPNRWLFKAPHHKFHLEPIVAAYPDIRFIFTHRDPGKSVPSYASFVAALYPPYVRDRIGKERIGREIHTHLLTGMPDPMNRRSPWWRSFGCGAAATRSRNIVHV